jgi:imidazole glycerol-phosphate synthase subunit HisH
MSRVHLIDYGMGNLDSVRRAIEECGGEAVWAREGGNLSDADRIIVPGVGGFAEGMAELERRGFDSALRTSIEGGAAVLGICLGMQLLAGEGEEGGHTAGLGVIPGRVVRLVPNGRTDRIPHVGWNEVLPAEDSALFREIEPGKDFYFVHSYQFVCADPKHVLATTPYCGGFVSAVRSGRVWGVQFHPEKSQRPGLRLLENFLAL